MNVGVKCGLSLRSHMIEQRLILVLQSESTTKPCHKGLCFRSLSGRGAHTYMKTSDRNSFPTTCRWCVNPSPSKALNTSFSRVSTLFSNHLVFPYYRLDRSPIWYWPLSSPYATSFILLHTIAALQWLALNISAVTPMGCYISKSSPVSQCARSLTALRRLLSLLRLQPRVSVLNGYQNDLRAFTLLVALPRRRRKTYPSLCQLRRFKMMNMMKKDFTSVLCHTSSHLLGVSLELGSRRCLSELNGLLLLWEQRVHSTKDDLISSLPLLKTSISLS